MRSILFTSRGNARLHCPEYKAEEPVQSSCLYGFYQPRPLNRLFIACGSLKEDSTLSCRKKNSLKLDTEKDFHKLSFGNYFLSLAHSIFSIRFYLTGSTIIELRSFYRSDTVGLRYKAVFWVTPSFKKLKKAAPLGGFSYILSANEVSSYKIKTPRQPRASACANSTSFGWAKREPV